MYKDIKKVFSYMWMALSQYKIYFFSSILLFSLYIVLDDALIPLVIKKLVDALGGGNFVLAKQSIIILALVYLLGHLLVFLSLRLLVVAEINASRILHMLSYEGFTKHSYRFYTNSFTGALVNKMERLGKNVMDFSDMLVFNAVSILISFVSIFILLFRENSTIAFILLTFVLVYTFIVTVFNKKITKVYEERSRARSKFSAFLSDIFTNIQTVLAFGTRDYEKKRFRRVNQDLFKKQTKAYVLSTNYFEGLSVIPTVFIIIIVFYSVLLAQKSILTTGSVVMIFLLTMRLNQKVWKIGNIAKRFAATVSDTVEAIEIIEKPVSVIDPEKPEKVSFHTGDIVFKNVSFTYPQGDHVFEKFNLHIPAGQSVGLVGKSGSGKTTLVTLLLRFYDIDDGQINIDGQDISRIKQSDLRSSIAYIPQDTILFHRSIYENISYGNLKAKKDEVMEASRSAYVDEFVKKLKKRYKTEVGERGIKLSGGQRQRIGVARAMLKKDAPILLLDEATSSLDSVSEAYIQKSFEKLAHNRTTIVIAHRLSTIQKMDRIIVMDKGKILEDGSHEELLKKKSHYYKLWNSQVDGFIREQDEVD